MTGARQDFAADFSIEQDWQNYSEEEHAVCTDTAGPFRSSR